MRVTDVNMILETKSVFFKKYYRTVIILRVL